MKVSQKEIYDYLISKGLSPNHVLGMLANIKAESSFDSSAIGDNGTSGGLFQHHNERFTAMKEFAGEDWKTNWKGQIDYALTEKDTEKYKNQDFNNPQDASKWFTINWERPKNAVDSAEKRIKAIPEIEKSIVNYDVETTEEEKPVQYQQVMGPEGEMITIPIGEDVTQEQIKKEQKAEETGEVVYSNWNEVYKDIDNIDKSQPITIGENKYKWASRTSPQGEEKGEGEFLLINNDGTFKTKGGQRLTPFGIVDKEDPNYTQLLIQREARGRVKKEIEQTKENLIKLEEDKAASIIDADKDGVPDNIDIDGGKGVPTDQEEVVPPPSGGTEQLSRLQQAGNIGASLLKGSAAVLDGLGGPGAIISYIMGKKGLKAAMEEIKPMSRPELSPIFMQHLRQTKELAKKGFHPSEEMKFRKELDKSYQIGLENAVRGSGGSRARYLAQSGVLDAQRSSALLDYAVKDDELQKKNAEKYQKLMLFKENFDLERTEKERLEDMERQEKRKDAAINFTSAAFTNAMSGLNTTNFSALADLFLSGDKKTSLGMNITSPLPEN